MPFHYKTAEGKYTVHKENLSKQKARRILGELRQQNVDCKLCRIGRAYAVLIKG